MVKNNLVMIHVDVVESNVLLMGSSLGIDVGVVLQLKVEIDAISFINRRRLFNIGAATFSNVNESVTMRVAGVSVIAGLAIRVAVVSMIDDGLVTKIGVDAVAAVRVGDEHVVGVARCRSHFSVALPEV
jgi:hypothetical protein